MCGEKKRASNETQGSDFDSEVHIALSIKLCLAAHGRKRGSVILNQWFSIRNIWQRLGTFLVVTTWGCNWHIVNRDW